MSKLILDEWIVREVIDTLYQARTTFLGITGLDTPQEVARKSANETAITRRISKSIDIIQQAKQQEPEGLDEAAKVMDKAILAVDIPDDAYNSYDHQNIVDACKKLRAIAFKSGVEWAFGQGVTVEGKIVMDFSEPRDIINRRLVANLGDALLKVEPGDVLIQIRKK